MKKQRPVSQKSYDTYKREYARVSSRNPMATPLFTRVEFERAFKEFRNTGIKNPSQFIARGQRKYTTAQVRSSLPFARRAWDELKEISTEIEKDGIKKSVTALDEFKEKFGFKNKRSLNQKRVLEEREEIFKFFREELGYTNDEVDEIFSPKEE